MNTKMILRFFFSFQGREMRKSFWLCFAINIILSTTLYIPFIISLPFPHINPYHYDKLLSALCRTQMWFVLPALLVLWTNRWAMIARRLHDAGQSFLTYILLKSTSIALFLLPAFHYFSLIPLTVLLILLCLPSKKNTENNNHGF